MTGSSQHLTVAVVEDDPRIRQLIEDEVVDEGHQVESFVSAESFLEKVNRTPYNLVLLDLMLPGMNGLECLLTLQGMSWGDQVKPTVIVVTALNDGEMRQQVFEAGASDYILKPDLFLCLPELLSRHAEGAATEPSP